ncbi:hypothetical protein MTBBW1_550020 [Desulfamplus magnetovallimortis]|uniref:Transposase n=1 Tax=Desulfamplus magnetovallimortis TaxID=1246637 RepID=A0A1W1HI02_9BACT|nr:hypothetical protein MTBBW1_550020 [Desulfamplus magnetovallimortis]
MIYYITANKLKTSWIKAKTNIFKLWHTLWIRQKEAHQQTIALSKLKIRVRLIVETRHALSLR